MKYLVAALFAGLSLQPCPGQTLSQDAEGQSSILYYGGAVGFDVGKPAISFSYSNLGKSYAKEKQGRPVFIYGVNAFGGNTNNVADLFKGGDFQAQSGFSAIAGMRIRMDKIPVSHATLEADKKQLQKERDSISKEITALGATPSPGAEGEIKRREARLEEIKTSIHEINARLEKTQGILVRRVLLLYGRAGRSAAAFKRALPNPDPGGFSVVFEDEKFNGKNFSAGVNYETGRFLFGFETSHEYTDNLDMLSSNTYTLTTTETVGNQTLVSTREITAYAGTYATYQRVSYNADVIVFSAIDSENKEYIAWNLYLRGKVSRDRNVIPTYKDLGAGAYFFNKENKFLGGLYLEAPDVSQDLEAVKEDPQYRKLQNRLSFGIVARFNFASIIGPEFK